MKEGKRLLIVLANTMLTGATKYALMVAQGLKARGWDLQFVVVGRRGRMDEELQSLTTVRYLGSRLRELTAKGYDAVLFFNVEGYEVIPQLSRSAPCYLTLLYDLSHAADWVHRANALKPYLAEVATDSIHNQVILEEAGIQATVIPGACDLDLFKPSRKDGKSVAWIGRLTLSKGADIYLKVAEALPQFKFVMVGPEDDDLYPWLKVNARNLELRVGIPEEEKAALLSKTQYYLHTAIWDNMPLSLIEAMASGCVCIARPVGEIPRMIEDGVNGYLVPGSADFTVWLRERLTDFNVWLKPSCGLAARQTALERFDAKMLGERFDDLLT